jgi:hypothetical protein
MLRSVSSKHMLVQSLFRILNREISILHLSVCTFSPKVQQPDQYHSITALHFQMMLLSQGKTDVESTSKDR